VIAFWARLGVGAVFFLNGFGFASWVPRIAEVKARLDLGEGELGAALFAIAAGALLAMPAAGVLAVRFGSRRVTTAALVLFLLAPIPWALAPGLAALALGFLAIGASAGALDVAMNAQGVAVERAYGRPIMASLHGLFSLGGMAGALVAGGLVAAGLPLAWHMALVAALALPAGLVACRAMLPAGFDPGTAGPAFALPGRGLLGLGVIAFCALLMEGAVADWSAVYIAHSLGGGGTIAALAFAAFQLAMAAGRFAGDGLIGRFGAPTVVRTGGLVAAAGLGGALLIGHPAAALAGFALVGAGIAATFPVTVSAAARHGGMAAGHAVAAIATLGYLGFLVGPPAIGGAAEMLGLPAALGLLPLLALTIALIGRRVEQGGPALAPSSARAG